jgi:hypothetical protein
MLHKYYANLSILPYKTNKMEDGNPFTSSKYKAVNKIMVN